MHQFSNKCSGATLINLQDIITATLHFKDCAFTDKIQHFTWISEQSIIFPNRGENIQLTKSDTDKIETPDYDQHQL